CTEFSRAGGEPLVLSPGSGETAQLLALACAGTAAATRGCADHIRRAAGHTHRIQKACDRIAKRSNINKPRRQRCSALAARQAATCAYE
ncbi:MAG: hypothetical protein WAV38_14815, partial [Xanthobacteraceae bacterium]